MLNVNMARSNVNKILRGHISYHLKGIGQNENGAASHSLIDDIRLFWTQNHHLRDKP